MKIIYKNQDKIKKEFIKFILPYLKSNKFFKGVWIWGSLVKGKFGTYSEEYKGRKVSDVDLLVEVDELYKIPKELRELKEWTKTRTYSRAFYSSLNFKYKSNKHKVDFICHFPSKHTKEGFFSKVKESEIIYKK